MALRAITTRELFLNCQGQRIILSRPRPPIACLEISSGYSYRNVQLFYRKLGTLLRYALDTKIPTNISIFEIACVTFKNHWQDEGHSQPYTNNSVKESTTLGRTGGAVVDIETPPTIKHIASSHYQPIIAFTTSDSAIHLYDFERGVLADSFFHLSSIQQTTQDGSVGQSFPNITSLAFMGNHFGDHLVIGLSNGTLYLWKFDLVRHDKKDSSYGVSPNSTFSSPITLYINDGSPIPRDLRLQSFANPKETFLPPKFFISPTTLRLRYIQKLSVKLKERSCKPIQLLDTKHLVNQFTSEQLIGEITCLRFSPSGMNLAIGTVNSGLWVHNIPTGATDRVLPGNVYSARVTHMSWNAYCPTQTSINRANSLITELVYGSGMAGLAIGFSDGRISFFQTLETAARCKFFSSNLVFGKGKSISAAGAVDGLAAQPYDTAQAITNIIFMAPAQAQKYPIILLSRRGFPKVEVLELRPAMDVWSCILPSLRLFRPAFRHDTGFVTKVVVYFLICWNVCLGLILDLLDLMINGGQGEQWTHGNAGEKQRIHTSFTVRKVTSINLRRAIARSQIALNISAGSTIAEVSDFAGEIESITLDQTQKKLYIAFNGETVEVNGKKTEVGYLATYNTKAFFELTQGDSAGCDEIRPALVSNTKGPGINCAEGNGLVKNRIDGNETEDGFIAIDNLHEEISCAIVGEWSSRGGRVACVVTDGGRKVIFKKIESQYFGRKEKL